MTKKIIFDVNYIKLINFNIILFLISIAMTTLWTLKLKINKDDYLVLIIIKNCIFISIKIYNYYSLDPTVRDNSAEALGTAWKVVSEKNILPFLTTVDAIKLAKVGQHVRSILIFDKNKSFLKT